MLVRYCTTRRPLPEHMLQTSFHVSSMSKPSNWPIGQCAAYSCMLEGPNSSASPRARDVRRMSRNRCCEREEGALRGSVGARGSPGRRDSPPHRRRRSSSSARAPTCSSDGSGSAQARTGESYVRMLYVYMRARIWRVNLLGGRGGEMMRRGEAAVSLFHLGLDVEPRLLLHAVRLRVEIDLEHRAWRVQHLLLLPKLRRAAGAIDVTVGATVDAAMP